MAEIHDVDYMMNHWITKNELEDCYKFALEKITDLVNLDEEDNLDRILQKQLGNLLKNLRRNFGMDFKIPRLKKQRYYLVKSIAMVLIHKLSQ